jgi:N-acetylgalactosamine kinase
MHYVVYQSFDACLCRRCRLFVFTEGEWKERGVGDLKLSKHKETHLVRLLMRQDKTLKVRANHKVDPNAALVAHAGSDKAWTFKANDYAEEKLQETKFAVSFKDKEKADAFKKAFVEAQENNKTVFASGGHGHASPAKAPAPAGGAGVAASGLSKPLFTPAPAPVKDTSGPVAVTDNIEVIYGAAAANEAIVSVHLLPHDSCMILFVVYYPSHMQIRYGDLTTAFKKEFGGVEPAFYVRAPGRVNLIGEHVDYHGYSVLPMALAQDVVIAVATGAPGGPVKVANVNSKYAGATLPSNPAAAVDQSGGVQWHQYVQCGYKGAFDFAKEKGVSTGEPKGLYLMVDGRVPAGAGVSSSSALTVASLLAVARAYGVDEKATRAEIGEAARKCELHIGTMSGGMDQAISCLATAGSAARIDFEPLRAANITLPAGATFVISNTLEEVPKAVDAEKRYNKRVTEGKLAAKLIAKGHGVSSWQKYQTLRQLQEDLKLDNPAALLPLIEKNLKADAYSLEDLEKDFGVDVATLFEGDAKKAGALKVLTSVAKGDKTFELRSTCLHSILYLRTYIMHALPSVCLFAGRARHVASEAGRVWAFQAACEAKTDASSQIKALGNLMNESHASCRDDYECSSAGLDAVTSVATAHGALGSRLTGAGWGGCAVSIVPTFSVPAFIAALKAEYYAKHGKDAEGSGAIFVSAPGSGAAVYTPPTSFEI